MCVFVIIAAYSQNFHEHLPRFSKAEAKLFSPSILAQQGLSIKKTLLFQVWPPSYCDSAQEPCCLHRGAPARPGLPSPSLSAARDLRRPTSYETVFSKWQAEPSQGLHSLWRGLKLRRGVRGILLSLQLLSSPLLSLEVATALLHQLLLDSLESFSPPPNS